MILERRTLIVRSPHWYKYRHGMWNKLKALFNFIGAVAQLGERYTCTVEVAGSIPVSSTMHGKATLPFFSNGYCLLTGRVACN